MPSQYASNLQWRKGPTQQKQRTFVNIYKIANESSLFLSGRAGLECPDPVRYMNLGVFIPKPTEWLETPFYNWKSAKLWYLHRNCGRNQSDKMFSVLRDFPVTALLSTAVRAGPLLCSAVLPCPLTLACPVMLPDHINASSFLHAARFQRPCRREHSDERARRADGWDAVFVRQAIQGSRAGECCVQGSPAARRRWRQSVTTGAVLSLFLKKAVLNFLYAHSISIAVGLSCYDLSCSHNFAHICSEVVASIFCFFVLSPDYCRRVTNVTWIRR